MDSNSIKPLMPRYLSIRDLKIISQSPLTFSLRVGNSPSTIKKIEVTGEILCLLSLADGTRTTEELYSQILSVNPNLSRKEYAEILNRLLSERLITDGRDEGLLPASVVDRYQRHLLFYSLFHNKPQEVQSKLQNSVVAILGVGGIGTWLSYLLASAGGRNIAPR